MSSYHNNNCNNNKPNYVYSSQDDNGNGHTHDYDDSPYLKLISSYQQQQKQVGSNDSSDCNRWNFGLEMNTIININFFMAAALLRMARHELRTDLIGPPPLDGRAVVEDFFQLLHNVEEYFLMRRSSGGGGGAGICNIGDISASTCRSNRRKFIIEVEGLDGSGKLQLRPNSLIQLFIHSFISKS